jgi:hypothetical protein
MPHVSKILNLKQKIKERWLLFRHIQPFIRRNSKRIILKTNTICGFSMMRSGSTWLSEIICEIPKTCTIGEPLMTLPIEFDLSEKPIPRFRTFPELYNLNFHFLQPIPETAEWPEAYTAIEKLFMGRAFALYIYEIENFAEIKNIENFFVQFNYANLMMHWILKNFNVSAIALLRHPCAVIASQLELPAINKIKQSSPGIFPDFPFNDIYLQHLDYLATLKTREQLLAFLWSLQVKEVFYHPSKGKRYLPLAYENLLLHYEEEITRLFKWIDKDIPAGVWNRKMMPSSSTSDSARSYIGKNSQLNKWQSKLKKGQISDILEVVKTMGIDFYDQNPEPDLNKLYH